MVVYQIKVLIEVGVRSVLSLYSICRESLVQSAMSDCNAKRTSPSIVLMSMICKQPSNRSTLHLKKTLRCDCCFLFLVDDLANNFCSRYSSG